MKKILIFIFVLFTASYVQSAKINVDSLKTVISNPKTDRSEAFNLLYKALRRSDIQKAKQYLDLAYQEGLKYNNKKQLGASLNDLGSYFRKKNEIDTAKALYEKALKTRTKIQDTSGVSKVYNNLGILYFITSQYDKAVENLQKALKYKLLLKDYKGAGISYNTLGNVYKSWGDNDNAIENYQKALSYFDTINFPVGVASCYNSIGLVYFNLGNLKDTVMLNEALKYHKMAADINIKIDNIKGLAETQSNIANIYAAKADEIRKKLKKLSPKSKEYKAYLELKDKYFQEAIRYNEESATNREKINDIGGLAGSYVGLASIYVNQVNGKDALKYLKKAEDLNKKIKNPYLSSTIDQYFGRAYILVKDYKSAIEHIKKAEETATKANLKTDIPTIYESFSEAYDSIGDYKQALSYMRKFKETEDSLKTADRMKAILDLQTKYETDKKEAALKVANLEKEKVEKTNQNQQLIIYGFIGVFIIVIAFSIIVFRQFKQIQKNNKELEHKNALITEQKEEITDSIHYAERIQRAILPQDHLIDEKISDKFILFKPKDIVSGDFYWMKVIERSKLLIATAADCTGHGVPGAFMSMLGVAFLNEIVTKPKVQESGQVLDNLRQSVISSLHQTGKEGEQQDGMDISLIAYNYETKELMYSGANNPLYIIRKNDAPVIEADKTVKGEHHTLYEIKADKMPIGIYKKELVDFKTNRFQLIEGDVLYMFSDGYADQFGGPKGKKFKYKPFKQLILNNVLKPMSEQREIFDTAFEDWKGDLEQIDDIILIGIKI